MYNNITIPDDCKDNDIITLQKLKTIILLKDNNFLLKSSNPKLQEAIEFSRIFYNHGDLSMYPFTKSISLNNDAIIHRFSKEEKLFLRICFRNHEDDITDTSSIGLKLSIIDIIISSLLLLMDNDSIMTFRWHIDNDHINAIKQMVELIQNDNSKDDDKVIIKSWNDVCVFLVIQIAFHEFIKEFTNGDSNGDSNGDNSPILSTAIDEFSATYMLPSNFFSGTLYFKLLSSIRKKSSSNLERKLQALLQETQHLVIEEQVNEEPKVEVLPIDEHKEVILTKIMDDRIIMLHGETGSGKSSRVPQRIYEDAKNQGKNCKMMISQPTRIAARSLMNRLRTTMGKLVGVRLGNNVRDESEDTKIHFCTTGYLVRYLAHKPRHFLQHTHLIIDEIHTRSVDGDILCLLVKRLLKVHKTLKVILMSATIHTSLIAEYFTRDTDQYYGDLKCLSVGKRRFPLTIHYLDDLIDRNSKLSNFKIALASEELLKKMKTVSGDQSETIAERISNLMYQICEELVKKIGVVGGGSILIFVAGISDIEEIMSRFEGDKYKTIAIHSDIPEDEQALAFEPCKPDEVKVIIATNAAESSLTLPDVDYVICLGQCKSIRYDSVNHKNMLLNTWISKASATQRAGRTGILPIIVIIIIIIIISSSSSLSGRVRNGTVYRLYTEELYNKLQDHDEAEIKRQTCEETILNLRYMLESTEGFEGVIPILHDLMEPPGIENIEYSFNYLHNNQLISKPNDDGDLTKLGKFSACLNISSTLARMIAIGYKLGLGYECVILAAGISLPKMIFNIAIPLVQSCDYYIDIAKRTFLAQHKLDDGLYSQPLMFISIFSTYMSLSDDKQRRRWVTDNCMSYTRVRQFVSLTKSLIENVNDLLNDEETFNIHKAVPPLTPSSINLLRFILTFTCDRNFIRLKPIRKFKSEQLHSIEINNQSPISEQQVSDIFPKNVVPDFRLITKGKKVYTAPVEMLESRELGNIFLDIRILNHIVNIVTKKSNIQSSLLWTKAKRVDETDKVQNSLFLAIVKEIIDGDVESSIYFNTTTYNMIFNIFRTKLQHLDDIVMNEYIVSYYTVSVFNEVDIEILKSISEKVQSSLSLSIPISGTATLSVANLDLNSEQIQAIFVGCTKKNNNEIREETLSCKQFLTFAGPQPNGLLTDISIGLKLLLTYTLMNKVSKVRDSIEIINISNDNDENNINANCYSQSGYGGPKEVDNHLIINFGKIIISNWQYLNDKNDVLAKFPRQSIQAVTIPCSDDGKNVSNKTQYAIASSIKIIGSSQNMVICEHVTFLPPGTKWLSLAAACCGINLKEIPGHISCIAADSSHTKTNGDLSTYEIEKCKEIYCIMSDLNADLVFNQDLKDMMESIFSEFL